MAEVTLVLGGARSGKTARALALTPAPRVYIATAPAPGDGCDGGDGAHDAEMAARIAAHKAERGADWDLIEAPLDLAGALAAAGARAALVDCLTLWLSNLIFADRDPAAETERLIGACAAARAPVIMVSNEIGLGLVPMEALSRRFRDEQGRLNQRVAAMADRVEFVAAGLPLRLK